MFFGLTETIVGRVWKLIKAILRLPLARRMRVWMEQQCYSVMGPFSLAISRATGSMAPPATKTTCIYFEYIFNSRSILLWTPIKRNSNTIQPVLNKRERIRVFAFSFSRHSIFRSAVRFSSSRFSKCPRLCHVNLLSNRRDLN